MMAATVRPGDVLLGKYKVERILGQGGMGLVVAARHLDLGGLFAIKFLLPGAVASPDAVSRFVREARAAASLRSEHVAKVHDVGRLEDGMPYMLMEHLEGADLGRVLRKNGPLPVEDTATLLLQACDAIAEAHAIGIVHRDIKPSNLFLTRKRNGKPCLKVLDFGISKQIDGRSTSALTKSGALLGSPSYMSPEQVDDSRTVDERSDIWSLGVVLYELTTGKLPFEDENIGRLIVAILDAEPKPPSEVREWLPPELDGVVMRCLRKNAADRYASVEELGAALRALLSPNGALSRKINVAGLGESGAFTAMSTLDALGVATTAEASAFASTEPAEPLASPLPSASTNPAEHAAASTQPLLPAASTQPLLPAASTQPGMSATVEAARASRSPRTTVVAAAAAGLLLLVVVGALFGFSGTNAPQGAPAASASGATASSTSAEAAPRPAVVVAASGSSDARAASSSDPPTAGPATSAARPAGSAEEKKNASAAPKARAPVRASAAPPSKPTAPASSAKEKMW